MAYTCSWRVRLGELKSNNEKPLKSSIWKVVCFSARGISGFENLNKLWSICLPLHRHECVFARTGETVTALSDLMFHNFSRNKRRLATRSIGSKLIWLWKTNRQTMKMANYIACTRFAPVVHGEHLAVEAIYAQPISENNKNLFHATHSHVVRLAGESYPARLSRVSRSKFVFAHAFRVDGGI